MDEQKALPLLRVRIHSGSPTCTFHLLDLGPETNQPTAPVTVLVYMIPLGFNLLGDVDTCPSWSLPTCPCLLSGTRLPECLVHRAADSLTPVVIVVSSIGECDKDQCSRRQQVDGQSELPRRSPLPSLECSLDDSKCGKTQPATIKPVWQHLQPSDTQKCQLSQSSLAPLDSFYFRHVFNSRPSHQPSH